MNPIRSLERALTYIKARLGERSTLAGIMTAIAGAAALATPWSYASMALGTVMALYPEKPNA